MLKWLVRARRRLRGPVVVLARALHLQRPLRRAYGRLLAWGTGPSRILTIDMDGHDVRFRMTSRAEASVLVDHWEMQQIRLLAGRLRPGDVLWDIGANLGLFACCLGVVGGDDLIVHAFEPVPMNAERLAENFALNGLAGARVHQVALADRRDLMTMFTRELVGTPTSSLVAGHYGGQGEDRREITVPVHPPIAYAEEAGIPVPSIVKCDVEGAEAAVLRAMRPWLESGRIRVLVVEYHPTTLAEQGESADALEQLVVDTGFETRRRISRPGGTDVFEAVYERSASATSRSSSAG